MRCTGISGTFIRFLVCCIKLCVRVEMCVKVIDESILFIQSLLYCLCCTVFVVLWYSVSIDRKEYTEDRFNITSTSFYVFTDLQLFVLWMRVFVLCAA